MDHDAGLAALTALREALRDRGADYAHLFAAAPNSGRPTGIDLDGDGRTWRARDAHGYGLFSGDGGMALLSRFPIGGVRDFTGLPWVALPGNAAEGVTPAAALPILRLHSVGAWDVEVLTPAGTLNLLASHASAPVFDGPEDRNGLRNADELLFWVQYLGGWTPGGFVLVRRALRGDGNLQHRPGARRGQARGPWPPFGPMHGCRTRSRAARMVAWSQPTGPRTVRASCAWIISCHRGRSP